MSVTKTTRDRIIELHMGIVQVARRSVMDAIKIGQLLSEQKERMKHGEFLPWLEELPFEQRTSYRYMALYQYHDKIAIVANLQEAYKKVEQIEYTEKKEREKEDQKVVFEYKKTGKKPDGWERRHDYLYKKMLDDGEYEKRKQAVFEEKRRKREQEDEEIRQASAKKQAERDEYFENLRRQTEQIAEQSSADEELKKKLRLSRREENLSQEIMFDTITDYLESFSNDSGKLEAVNNLIKFLITIAQSLHRESINRVK